jgi:CheY-like chemotaxis protein
MPQSNSILIVEDNADMAEIYRDTLAALSHSVTVIGSGRAAIDAVNAQQPPEVVVMDLTLPDMGWQQVLEAVRARAQSHPIRLILVSGRHDLADIARDHAGVAHLQKPFDILELVKLLE